MELSQLKSLEPQLSDDSPLENFVRLTEDALGRWAAGGGSESHGWIHESHGWMKEKIWKDQETLAFGSERLLLFCDL